MSKKIFKEEQHFGGWEVIALLAFFIIGLTYKFISQHWLSPVAEPMSIWTYAVFTLPLAAALWYFVNLGLSVKVTEKNISAKYTPFGKKKHKIKWENVEEYEFHSYSGPARTSGWNVNYNHEKRISLNGGRGVYLTTKDGDNVFIGTKNLSGLKQAISKVLK